MTDGPDGVITTEFAVTDLGVLADLRTRVREFLTESTTTEVIETAALVVTELATNALTHGKPAEQLRLELFADRLRIEVPDQDPTPPALHTGDHVRLPGTGGLGLYLVERLTTHWGHTPTGTGKTVWAELCLIPAPEHVDTPPPPRENP